MKKNIFIVLVCGLLLCVGCGKQEKADDLTSYMEAKEMIINNNAILVDVRTKEEYDGKHLDGAVLLTLESISEETASNVIETKDSYVILYCNSGSRSSEAMNKLKELGYTNIYDLGSLNNWKE